MKFPMNVLVLAPKTDTVLGRQYTNGIQCFWNDMLWDKGISIICISSSMKAKFSLSIFL